MTLGQRLKEVRGKTSQRKFASELGISRNTYTRYEKDEISPKMDFLEDVSSKLGVNLGWLLTGKGHKDDKPVQDIDVEAAYIIEDLEEIAYDTERGWGAGELNPSDFNFLVEMMAFFDEIGNGMENTWKVSMIQMYLKMRYPRGDEARMRMRQIMDTLKASIM